MRDKGLPVVVGGGEVERLLVDVGAEGEEFGFGLGGDEGVELGAGLSGWARIERAQAGEVHGAVEGGFNSGAGDGGLEPGFELGAGGERSEGEGEDGDAEERGGEKAAGKRGDMDSVGVLRLRAARSAQDDRDFFVRGGRQCAPPASRRCGRCLPR